MKTSYVPEALNGGQYILAVAQSNETFQMIELIASICVSIVLVAYRLWKWYKEAKKDGKITKEEIEEGAKIVSDGVSEIKDKTKKEEERNDF